MNDRIELLCQVLESGNVGQTTGQLARGDNRCCLGVACDLAGAAGVPLHIEVVEDDDDGRQTVRYDSEAARMLEAVREYFGFATDDGYFIDEDGRERTLAGMNDNGYRFSEIAAIIRSAPEGLFA